MKRAGLAAAIVLIASTAAAQAEELRRLPIELDPAKAYVVVELGQLDEGMLPGTLTLTRYDAATKDITLPEARQPVIKPLVKDGKRRLHLVAVQPGLWVVEAANDTAFALGSNTVQLTAGSVTDLGVAKVYSDFAEGEKRDVLTTGRMMKGALMGGIFGSVMPRPTPKAVEFRTRDPGDMALPGVLAGAAQPVASQGDVRFANHLGGLINRMGGRRARPGATRGPDPATPAADPATGAGTPAGKTGAPANPAT